MKAAISTEIRPASQSERVKTSLGLLPADWQVVRLDTVAVRGSGHTPNKQHPEYWNGPIKWISLADSDQLDRTYIADTANTITASGIAHSSAVLHPAGTVVLSRDAGIGRSTIMAEAMAVSQHFMAWRCGSDLDNRFLYYWLQRQKPEFERISNGTTIKTIGLPYFEQLEIPLPSVREQVAIATALLDVDALIGALDKLIEKKRAIKLATMQQLLTGKTRLPGFSRKWSRFKFGELARLRRDRIDPRVAGAQLFCVELEHIEQGTGQLNGSTHAGPTSSAKAMFDEGDVLFGRLRAYLRKFWLADRGGVCSTEIWVMSANRAQVVPGFLFQLVRDDQFIEVASTTYGTHMPRSDWNVVRRLAVNIPDLDEQAAIVAVLSDLDAEIAALKQRRDKTKQIKQGMMQVLLTGRIRVVEGVHPVRLP